MDNTETTYPQYFMAVDKDGNATALVIQNKDNCNYVLPEGVVYTVATIDDVKASVPGEYVSSDPAEYERIYKAWKGEGNADTTTSNPAEAASKTDDQSNEAGNTNDPATAGNDVSGNAETGATGGSQAPADQPANEGGQSSHNHDAQTASGSDDNAGVQQSTDEGTKAADAA